jgi:hypothetical protein
MFFVRLYSTYISFDLHEFWAVRVVDQLAAHFTDGLWSSLGSIHGGCDLELDPVEALGACR